jgi:hypothetical protein
MRNFIPPGITTLWKLIHTGKNKMVEKYSNYNNFRSREWQLFKKWKKESFINKSDQVECSIALSHNEHQCLGSWLGAMQHSTESWLRSPHYAT